MARWAAAGGLTCELPVAIMAQTLGVRSAAIEVLDAETELVVHRVPLTVIAALALTEANG